MSTFPLGRSCSGPPEEVLDLVRDADWVHFTATTFKTSRIPLIVDYVLRIYGILLSRPRGGLAFLFACQTAMGDKNLSDEMVHAAAGMLFAGYGGAITWSISGRVAPRVAKDVYEQLLQTGARPDHREAARALHDAVGHLRECGVSFVEWLPFIHVGL